MVTARALLVRASAPVAAAIVVAALAGSLSAGARLLAAGCVVASAAAAAAIRRVDVRSHATAVLAIAAVTAAGQARGGLVYGVAATAFALAVVLAMRAARAGTAEERPPDATPVTRARDRRAIAALGLTGGAVAALLVFELPVLGGYVEGRIARMIGGAGSQQGTGFSSTLRLGSTRGMLESDTVVMRVEGTRPEYLRGAVYDLYAGHAWRSTRDGVTRRVERAGSPRGSSETVIELARDAPVARGREARWFLPAGACEIGTPSGSVTVDATGVSHPEPLWQHKTIWFSTERCEAAAATADPPSEADLAVPPSVRDALGPIAAEWTRGATSDHDKLVAIEHALRAYVYSLEVTRDERVDPVVDFLTVHREGHCESFASAMALLARAAGIPARVVTGYHVTEESLGGAYAIVRERHAHAWVEAWTDGRWRGWDPTPTTESLRARTSTLEQISDYAAFAFDRALGALSRLGLGGAAASFGAMAAALLVVRAALRRVSRRSALRRSRPLERPLPCFESLGRALERRGQTRVDSEPIERFARRVARVEAPWATAAEAALLAYAALRYGGVGDEDDVVARLDEVARSIDRA